MVRCCVVCVTILQHIDYGCFIGVPYNNLHADQIWPLSAVYTCEQPLNQSHMHEGEPHVTIYTKKNQKKNNNNKQPNPTIEV